MTEGFTDIHQHIVYGMDDGAKSLEESLAMLKAAIRENTSTIIATPHITPGVYAFDLQKFGERLEEVKECCVRQHIPVRLLAGNEILYTDQTCRFLEQGKAMTLAGTEYVLVEFSPNVRYEVLTDALGSVLRAGYLPVIAHVERYACLSMFPPRAKKLKERFEVRFQMNTSSVLGGKGFWMDRFCRFLLKEGLVDAVASDAHNTTTRPTRMRKAYLEIKRQYGGGYADYLTGRGGHGFLYGEE